MQTGDEVAKEDLIVEYLPLVKRIAGRLAVGLPSHVEEEELAACGVIGLLEAVERYDPSREASFKTFATWRIRGAMLDELRKATWVPRSVYQRLRQLQVAEQKMGHILGREPSGTELAGELGWTLVEVEQVYAQINSLSLLSLEELFFTTPATASSNVSGETISGGGLGLFARPEESLEKEERCELLGKAIEGLKEREKLVLALYYQEELTLREIGQVIKVSTARVSQIHAKAILNLREKLQEADYLEG